MTGECASCVEGARTLDGIDRQYGDALAVLAVDMDPGAWRRSTGWPNLGLAVNEVGTDPVRVEPAMRSYGR
ncbi:MAG: hypothetical protein ABR540_23345 [Acidimicrobiales bacterium]